MTAAFKFLEGVLDRREVEHLRRLHNALFNSYDLQDVVKYLVEKTYLNGDRFSFKDHEFQEDILSDISQIVNVQKCAQVGMSEAMARYSLAICRIMPYFNVILTMPSAGDASNFAQTRLDPIINNSPDLREMMDAQLNNSEVKSIGTGLLYMRGTRGTTAALSVPADMLIHDELDRSDPHTIGQYQSRIKHSKWKLVRKFGTPTVEGLGIAAEMAVSRKKRHMCKCEHCNNQFVPSYHDHVHIPGFDGEKNEINKNNLPDIRWAEAKLLCPRCGRAPSLQFDRREWVVENSDSNLEAVGYYVTPFSVPNVVTVASLVKESTKYGSFSEFVNQALGETASDKNEQLTKEDVVLCGQEFSLMSSDLHHMGIDVGQLCHITIGRLTGKDDEEQLMLVHRETCLVNDLKKRRRELKRQYRVLMCVTDIQPETVLVAEMQKEDPNLLGGMYQRSPKAPIYSVKKVTEALKEGKIPINRVDIQKNQHMDTLMKMIKARRLIWSKKGDRSDDQFVDHCADMKRKQELDKASGGIFWDWQKSIQAQDHFWHSLGYLYAACRLAPTASTAQPFVSHPIVMGIKMRAKKETHVIDAMR